MFEARPHRVERGVSLRLQMGFLPFRPRHEYSAVGAIFGQVMEVNIDPIAQDIILHFQSNVVDDPNNEITNNFLRSNGI